MDEKQLLENYVKQREMVDVVEANLKELKEALKKAELELIEYLSEREQTRTGSYEGLGSISLRSSNKYSVNEEDQENMFQFLKENNLDGVIKQSIHHATFNRIMNELVEEGKPLPEYVKTFNITSVTLNKG